MPPLITIGGTAIEEQGDALVWTAGLAIDADGSPHAYHPDGRSGLDYLANAGNPGRWWGVVCDGGVPVEQGLLDPAPGFLVSPTSLCDRTRHLHDPLRYVDSERIPYLAVPRVLLQLGLHLGDVAQVEYQGRSSPAIVADVGPADHLGEGSIALAEALGIPSSPRHGGCSSGVAVRVWRRSARGWPREWREVETQVEALALEVRS